jgi:hypothetical protein
VIVKTYHYLIVLVIIIISSCSNLFSQVDSPIDTISKKKFQPKNIFYEGSITVGYEYGLLPYLINSSPPSGNSKVEGVFGFKIKKLPFKSSFYYSSMSSVSGLNNYFRVQFDVHNYIQSLKDESAKIYAKALAKKDSLLRVKQDIMRQLSFYELIKKYKVYDTETLKKDAKDSLKAKVINKDTNTTIVGYDSLFAKKDRLYLLKTNKKCIKDSIRIVKRTIKKNNKVSILSLVKPDTINTKSLSRKEQLSFVKDDEKMLMDSLQRYKKIIKADSKRKKKKEKEDKKKLKKLKSKKGKITHEKDSIADYNNAKKDSLIEYKNKITQMRNPLDTMSLDSTKYLAKKDSLSDKKAEAMKMNEDAQNKYKKLKKQKEDIEAEIRGIDETLKQEVENEVGKKKKKLSNFLKYIKKFEIGSVNPDHSYFLSNNIPVTGINMEYNKNNFYLAFTHGKTINNIFLTNNLIKNQLNAVRNVYNFFDFNNINQGRKITSMKIGYGQKDKNHLFVGGLYGIGRTSYSDPNNDDIERNYVYEIDGKLFIKKNHMLDLIYGRSALQINGVNYEEQESVFNQLFGFKDRTNAALIRSTSRFFKNKTKLSLTFRYIDPFFISYGVGFLRNDNIRYELKLKQKLSKKITIGTFVRREEDNILNLYAYKNLLMSYGVDLTYRITKKTMVKADYRPIVQQIKLQGGPDVTNRSHIINLITTHTNRIRNTALNFTGIYSYYKLSNDSTPGLYKNYNLSIGARHKDKLENTISFNRFETNDTLSVPDANIIQNELSVYFKRLELSGIGKASFSTKLKSQFGYGLQLKYKVAKYLSWHLGGEKLILNDFYNSLSIDNIKDYPYFFHTSLTVFW